METLDKTQHHEGLLPFRVRSFIDLQKDLAETDNQFIEHVSQEKIGDLYKIVISLKHRHFDINCRMGEHSENEKWEGLEFSAYQYPHEENKGLSLLTSIEFKVSDVFPETEDSYVQIYETRDKEQMTLLFMRHVQGETSDFSMNQLLLSSE